LADDLISRSELLPGPARVAGDQLLAARR
jgi:hypothetical protein